MDIKQYTWDVSYFKLYRLISAIILTLLLLFYFIWHIIFSLYHVLHHYIRMLINWYCTCSQNIEYFKDLDHHKMSQDWLSGGVDCNPSLIIINSSLDIYIYCKCMLPFYVYPIIQVWHGACALHVIVVK